MVAKFIQCVNMTQQIVLNRMTTDKEIIEESKEELEIKIKDIFIWVLGEEAVTEMTKTVRDNDPNKFNINQLYSLFRLTSSQKGTSSTSEQIFSE